MTFLELIVNAYKTSPAKLTKEQIEYSMVFLNELLQKIDKAETEAHSPADLTEHP